MNLVERYLMGRDPWELEPNYKEFTHMRLHCLILRHPGGHLCGYVRVPGEHPFNYSSPYDADISVHGGITFYGELPDRKGTYCGFDCAHAGDFSPQFSKLFGIKQRPFETYRDMEYVTAEVISLAEQIKKHGGETNLQG